MPKKIVRLIPAIMFATTIATPALGYVDYECGCGSRSYLYNRPTCSAAPDYLTEYCVVKKTSSSFTYRMPFSAGINACNLCSCNSYTNDWGGGAGGVLTRDVYTATNTSNTRCDFSYEIEGACDSGYYGLSRQSMTSYTCQKCPSLVDIDTKTLDGTSEYANQYTDITACYIPKEDFIASEAKFQDATGIYTITDDCYYSR